MFENIVKTVQELNAAAVHLRQSGAMEELRKLAKSWGIPYKQTEEYIQGKRYLLADLPVAEKEFRTYSEKLREEMIVLDDKYFADIIAWHIIRKCDEDEMLGEMVLKKHKSLQRCLDYVIGKAYQIAEEQAKQKGMEHINGNMGLALTEKEVYPWAEEYYRNEDEKKVQEKAEEEKKRILLEWQSKENAKTTGSKKISSAKQKNKKKEIDPDISRDEQEKSREQKETSKKKEDGFGQMSLFDLAG